MNDDIEARGTLTAKLWMFLLKHGGRWKSMDLAKRLREDPTQVCQHLSAMARAGHVMNFEIPDNVQRRVSYGVTPACSIPRTITVGQVAECVGPLEEAEA